jgi:hypothetical protein
VLSAVLDDATGYGRVVRDPAGALDRIVEQKDASDDELAVTEINSGTYVFRAAPLRTTLALVSTDNAAQEKYLTDVIGLLRGDEHSVAALPAGQSWIVAGVNDRVQLADAGLRLNQMIVRGWQLAGLGQNHRLQRAHIVKSHRHGLGKPAARVDAVVGVVGNGGLGLHKVAVAFAAGEHQTPRQRVEQLYSVGVVAAVVATLGL